MPHPGDLYIEHVLIIDYCPCFRRDDNIISLWPL
jgi:hypothetical protein